MKVLVTGATGYIGSVVAEKLLAAGHEVIGLARSGEAVRKLEAAGVRPVRGSLQEVEGIARAAREADAVIHTAATGDASAPEADAQAVAAILDALDGTNKPFIYTSGVWVLGNTDGVADEETELSPTLLVAWRPAIEQRVLAATARGVRSIVLRPAMVYGRGGGIIGEMVQAGRQKKQVRFVGTGENRWSLIHVDDLADLYLKALEKAPAGTLLMAAAGEAMRVRKIAEAASRAAGLDGSAVESWPIEQARERLGPYADALVLDQQVSAAKAERLLGWTPRQPSLMEDLASGSNGN
jgi:nucleoside-diphosphate-sugar epimerase